VADSKDYNKVGVLIVGAGPAGLAAAIKIKSLKPEAEVCVIEKAAGLGFHNLSGAVLERDVLDKLLDTARPDWKESEEAGQVLGKKVRKDDVLFFTGRKLAFNICFALKIARVLRLGFGQMLHDGDYSVSVSRLTQWLGRIAKDTGVELLTGFAAEDIILDKTGQKVAGVKLVAQGLNRQGEKQPNFLEGEFIKADFVVLAEGCDGLLTEKFIEKAGLQRQAPQLYSVGIKELIKVSSRQYAKFGKDRVVHAMGYPLWTPVIGPAIFGGGIIYAGDDNHLAVGMIVAADWKYYDFNPQDALANFKEHKFVKQFIEGGQVVEAGAKMIPEGGYYAVPRETVGGSIGKANCIIAGDSAGFVNMLKIKGLHNAIDSGIKAGRAIAENFNAPDRVAERYTELVDNSNIGKEMWAARNFRQTIAKFGMFLGFVLSVFSSLLGKLKVEEDYKAMKTVKYRLKCGREFDKDSFTALASTGHREEQPSHLTIKDGDICIKQCAEKFNRACITFCPAGVYETVGGQVLPANPSNCLHCKTCQRKCPFDNIRWTVPEGAGGPKYQRM